MPEEKKQVKVTSDTPQKKHVDGTAYGAAAGLALGITLGLVTGYVAHFVAGTTLLGLITGTVIDVLIDKKNKTNLTTDDESDKGE
ncbi:MAG: hypothetical protein IJ462_00255 [Clostridia bacterium]|nr:hypothetical protein [Clostridia bacterium]